MCGQPPLLVESSLRLPFWLIARDNGLEYNGPLSPASEIAAVNKDDERNSASLSRATANDVYLQAA